MSKNAERKPCPISASRVQADLFEECEEMVGARYGISGKRLALEMQYGPEWAAWRDRVEPPSLGRWLHGPNGPYRCPFSNNLEICQHMVGWAEEQEGYVPPSMPEPSARSVKKKMQWEVIHL